MWKDQENNTYLLEPKENTYIIPRWEKKTVYISEKIKRQESEYVLYQWSIWKKSVLEKKWIKFKEE